MEQKKGRITLYETLYFEKNLSKSNMASFVSVKICGLTIYLSHI
jgi:hypothetical protein